MIFIVVALAIALGFSLWTNLRLVALVKERTMEADAALDELNHIKIVGNKSMNWKG